MSAAVNHGAYNFDTIEVAFNKRFQKGLFVDIPGGHRFTVILDLFNITSSRAPLATGRPLATNSSILSFLQR